MREISKLENIRRTLYSCLKLFWRSVRHEIKGNGFFLTALVLYIFQGGFITYSSWFNIHADKPVEALFKYENERGIFRIYQEKGEAGFISFPVSDKKIVGFWLNITGDAKINAVQFSGREERFFPSKAIFPSLKFRWKAVLKLIF